jgi:hypothetical protein
MAGKPLDRFAGGVVQYPLETPSKRRLRNAILGSAAIQSAASMQ